MASVKGPLMSMDASGKLANAVVFSKWKGRAYVRGHVVPSNPKSAGQKGVRAMMRFLAVVWDGLSALEKSGWETLAAATGISPFNAFVAYNMDRWTQFTTPIITPGQAAGTAPTMGALTVTGGVRQITYSQAITTPQNIWGVLFFLNATGTYTPARANCVYAAVYSASPVTAVLSDIEPGTYYADAIGFTEGGAVTAAVGEAQVTVT